jgi:hypothetical protein
MGSDVINGAILESGSGIRDAGGHSSKRIGIVSPIAFPNGGIEMKVEIKGDVRGTHPIRVVVVDGFPWLGLGGAVVGRRLRGLGEIGGSLFYHLIKIGVPVAVCKVAAVFWGKPVPDLGSVLGFEEDWEILVHRRGFIFTFVATENSNAVREVIKVDRGEEWPTPVELGFDA